MCVMRARTKKGLCLRHAAQAKCGHRPAFDANQPDGIARRDPGERRDAVKRCERCAAYIVPCSGEAHRNAYIDNCWSCAPSWGWVRQSFA
jgi:hypothetical protein